ncbi:MAG: PAS domain S-box protein [Candidatus Erginobacter occultus]|nr:PAS domain S-box protein [Candidatus Erginobacter occultus]
MKPPAPLRILFVEDVAAAAELAERALKKEGIVSVSTRVETETDFLLRLNDFRPDLIISDYALPHFNGMRALELTRKENLYLPFILLTGSINEETAVECIKAGADDYILKSKLARLPFSIREALKHTNDREERSRAEKALRESEDKLQSIFSAAPVGIGLIRDRVILETNDYLLTMTGYHREEMVDRDARFLYPTEEDYLYVGREKYRQLEEKGSGTVETRWKRKDGRIVDVLISSAYLDPGNPERGATFIALDITERKRSEDERRRSEKSFRLLAENTLDVIWSMDLETRFIYVNPAIREMFGCEPEEWEGTLLEENCDREHWEQMRGIIERARRQTDGHRGVIFETEMLHRDGHPIPVEVHGALIFDADRRPCGLQGVTRDISERKRAETEREKLREQLNQSQKLESVGRLAGAMAHDFNNMLQTILGNAELALRKSSPSDPLREYFEDILGAGELSVDLISSLMAFARKQVITPRKLDLNKAVAGMIKMLKPMLGEDIELAWEPGPGPARVNLDPTQLSQILANLLANARDAIAGVGKVTIAIEEARFNREWCRARPEYRVGRWIALEVRDDGLGMDREVLSHLFEPFFTTKEEGRGTGLGLATIYGIVTQNEGFILAESEPGRGSAFRIFFPPAPEPPRGTEGKDQSGPMPGGTETVLLAEDDQSILKLSRRYLEQLGYTVLAADSPATSLSLADDHPGKIDLLITDVVMPGLNGRDLWEKLLEGRPGLACLFVSGFTADVIARRQILEEGVNFLPKPFSLEELARAVRSALPAKTV